MNPETKHITASYVAGCWWEAWYRSTGFEMFLGNSAYHRGRTLYYKTRAIVLYDRSYDRLETGIERE